MANEAQILENPTSTPAAVSTGYQRQNTNAVAGRVGDDKTVVVGGTGKCTLQISGPVDVNGVLYTIAQSKDFTLSSADRYYIYLSGSGDYLSPTIGTDPGTFDADKNARYYSGYRVLNWVIDYDGATATAYRWIEPSEDGNNFVENDLIVGNDLTVEGDVTVEGYLKSSLGRRPTGTISDASITSNDIFDILDPLIPNIDDYLRISGGITNVTGFSAWQDRLLICAYARRTGATTIDIAGGYFDASAAGGGYSAITFVNGNTDTWAVGISW